MAFTMDKSKCILCFQISDRITLLEDDIKYKIQFIIPNLDLKLILGAGICKHCLTMVQICYDFKLSYIVKKEQTEGDKICEDEVLIKPEFEYETCCVCYRDYGLMKNDTVNGNVEAVFNNILETDIKLQSNICERCLNTIENISTFITTCLDTEKIVAQSFHEIKVNTSDLCQSFEKETKHETIDNTFELSTKKEDVDISTDILSTDVKLELKKEVDTLKENRDVVDCSSKLNPKDESMENSCDVVISDNEVITFQELPQLQVKQEIQIDEIKLGEPDFAKANEEKRYTLHIACNTQCSADEKAAIIGLWRQGKSARAIGRIINKDGKTVTKWIRRFQANGNTHRRPRPKGLTKCTTAQQDNDIVNYAKQNPLTNTSKILQHVNELQCSSTTILRRLSAAGINCHLAT